SEVGKLRRLAMDRATGFGMDRAAIVDRITEQIEHPSEGFFPDGHAERRAGVAHVHAARHSVGRSQRHGAHLSSAEMAGDFTDEPEIMRVAVVGCSFFRLHFGLDGRLDDDGVVNRWKLVFGEFGVEGGSDDLCHFSGSGHEQTSVRLKPWKIRSQKKRLPPTLPTFRGSGLYGWRGMSQGRGLQTVVT